MMHEIVLAGCAPAPLAHYLKALGVLRLVAEQKDAAVTGRWQGSRFVLRTGLDMDGLERFFLEEYQPTPIIAPWNGGSGFYPRDNRDGIDLLASAGAARFSSYRQIIALGRELVGQREKSPKADEKFLFLASLRAVLPDQALEWFDAAVLLTTDRAEYPPLLGTGGNDGRLDFTNNFMQRLVEVFSPADGLPLAGSRSWLHGALTGEATCDLRKKAIGQFAPGQAGGTNATTGFEASSLTNPWDFILMLEGGLLFAGSTVRRLEHHDTATLSFPFTVRTTGSGSGSAALTDERQARAEIWMPLWQRHVSLIELRTLLAEGRITVGRRPAGDGLDFVRAVTSFGVDRGVAAFQRFGFLMRSGKAYLATPLGEFRVVRTPDSSLLSHLDRRAWLERVRRFARQDKASARVRHLVRRLEEEIFSLSRSRDRMALQNLIVLLGRLQAALAAGGEACQQVPPMPLLGPEWALAADDGSAEYRLACALAGMEGMRGYVLPIAMDRATKNVVWQPGAPRAVGTGGDPVSALVRILDRRLIEARRNNGTPFEGGPAADLDQVLALLDQSIDAQRLLALFAGLVNVRQPRSLPRIHPSLPRRPPASYRTCKPLFTPAGLLHAMGILPPSRQPPLPAEIVRLLATCDRRQAKRAMAVAWRHLRSMGLRVPPEPPPDPGPMDPGRLALALMVPLSGGDLRQVCSPFLNEAYPHQNTA